MANYVAQARTNYFNVRDVDALRADLREHGIEPSGWDVVSSNLVLDENPNNKPEGSIAIFHYGPWPSLDENDDLYDDEATRDTESKYESFYDLVAAHLVEDSVAVFMEVGFEKMRYLAGFAIAINHKGETRSVDIDSIYLAAKELLSEDSEASISTASY